MVVLSGEAADVDPTVVSDWSERLKTICQGYALKDIFNADETGLFYSALPTRSMAVKVVNTSGKKMSKERITVLLACSTIGEKLTLQPILIFCDQMSNWYSYLPTPL